MWKFPKPPSQTTKLKVHDATPKMNRILLGPQCLPQRLAYCPRSQRSLNGSLFEAESSLAGRSPSSWSVPAPFAFPALAVFYHTQRLVNFYTVYYHEHKGCGFRGSGENCNSRQRSGSKRTPACCPEVWQWFGQWFELAEPLPILGNNTTSQPIRRLFLYSPLHLTNYITTTTPLPIPV